MFEFILLIILLMLSALFSASETAFISLSRIKVSRMIEEKLPGARVIMQMKEDPSEFLSTILLGNNLVNIAAASLATSMAIRFFEKNGWGHMGIAVGVATGIMTFFILIFGEITPKTVAIRNAEPIALFTAPIIWGLQGFLRPIVYLLGLVIRPFVFVFGGKSLQKGTFVTEEEIRLILAAGEQEGVIEEEEREMITSIFEFWDTVAREVMTPRPDIIAAEAKQPLEEIVKVILESGHSRIPIYEGNMDNIIGVVYAKDLLNEEVLESGNIKECLRQALFIPETKKVSDLLHEMQTARTHLAIIVDEYGMTSGLVSMEDLVEEIVGEIHDEFEREEKSVEKLDENMAVVDGKLSISDINDRLDLALPTDEYDTIGGLVFGRLGKAPAVGDSLRYEGLLISVERVHRRRITRVKIMKLPRRIEDEMVGG